MDFLLDCVLWTAGSKKISENKKALEIRSVYLNNNYNYFKEKLKLSSAEAIRNLAIEWGKSKSYKSAEVFIGINEVQTGV